MIDVTDYDRPSQTIIIYNGDNNNVWYHVYPHTTSGISCVVSNDGMETGEYIDNVTPEQFEAAMSVAITLRLKVTHTQFSGPNGTRNARYPLDSRIS